MKPQIELVGTNISLDTLRYIISRITKREINTVTENDLIYGEYSDMLQFYRLIFVATTSLRLYLNISNLLQLLYKPFLEKEFVADSAHEKIVSRIEKSIELLLKKEYKEEIEKYHYSPNAAVTYAFEISVIEIGSRLLPYLFSIPSDREALFLASNILSIFCLSNKALFNYIKERLKQSEFFWKKINEDFNRAMKSLIEMALRTYGIWQGYECLMTQRF